MLTLRAVIVAQLRLALAYLMLRRSLIGTFAMIFLVGLVAIGDGLPAIRVSQPEGAAGGGPDVSLMFMGEGFLGLATGMAGLCTAFFIVCLYGFLSSFRVWRDASPRQRAYHWTLPVKRSRHDLIRVAAGAVPMLVIVLALVVVAFLGLVIGGHSDTLRLVPASFWIAFTAAPVLLYLLSTIAVLRSDRPAVPILIALGSLYGIFMLSLFPAAHAVLWPFRLLVTGPYSLTVVLVGPAVEMLQYGVSAENARTIAESGLNTGAWPAAFTLWFALALAGLIVAAGIRPRKS